ncbi:type I secretion system permease/ATPase [Vibrio agarivorans]|uniref:type I secretion system permease/ATPase n=1 Tax=Vibrio agarivorans TaxID=153622 RepID=UPI0025B31E8B|nr:type I secretion system permease/ATPase [Vibrio agarivorans]MDN3659977.1 type I secretion system permease/ATPase [Vibrio agarivorans]
MGKDVKNVQNNLVQWLAQQFGVRSHSSQFEQDLPADLNSHSVDYWLRVCDNMQIEATLFSLEQAKKMSSPCILLFEHRCLMCEALPSLGKGRFFDGEEEHQLELNDLNLDDVKSVIVLAAKQRENDTSSHSAKWLFSVLREVRPWYRDLLIASFVINLLALVIPLFTMNVYDRVVPNQATETLWVLVVAVVVVLIFEWVLKESRSSITDMAGQYVDNKLSAILFQRVLGMKLENRPQSIGSFTRQIQDFDSVRDFFTSATLVTLVDLPFTVLFLLLIGWLGGPMLWIPVGVMAFVLLVSLVMKKRIADTFEHTSQLSMQKQAQLFDNITNLSEIKQFNAQRNVQSRWEKTSLQLSQWQVRSRFFSNIVSHTIQSSQHIVTVGLIIVGVHLIIAGELTMGGLIATVMLSGRAAGSVNQISMLLLRYQQTKAAVESVSGVMELPQEQDEAQVLSSGEVKGNIELHQLSFHYPACEGVALKEINLTITAGEKIGLIGPSGAGKSTLLALLARQYCPSSGQIAFEGVDARLWPLPLLRQGIGWAGQSPILLQGSVFENLLLGQQEVDEASLKYALETSGLAYIIPRLEKGLETQVGELGRNVSGGQRQAISLARAFYNKPKLMLLDEPTTSLDQAIENHFLKSFSTLDTNTTCVVSSHSRSLLQLCDRIVVMDGGRIVSVGTPDEILVSGGRSRVRNVSIVHQEVKS